MLLLTQMRAQGVGQINAKEFNKMANRFNLDSKGQADSKQNYWLMMRQLTDSSYLRGRIFEKKLEFDQNELMSQLKRNNWPMYFVKEETVEKLRELGPKVTQPDLKIQVYNNIGKYDKLLKEFKKSNQ